jgi:hypothetical protein
VSQGMAEAGALVAGKALKIGTAHGRASVQCSEPLSRGKRSDSPWPKDYNILVRRYWGV